MIEFFDYLWYTETISKEGADHMRYTITGRNIEVTQGLRDAVEDKLGKLEKYFSPDTEVIVTLSVQREQQKIEVTIPVKGSMIRAEEASTDMYVSIDLVEEIIERQIKKYRKKLIDRKQSAQAFSTLFMEEEEEVHEEEIRIEKTKHFDMKPMYPEDACLEWSFWDTAFTCSSTRRQTRSAWSIREKATPTD